MHSTGQCENSKWFMSLEQNKFAIQTGMPLLEILWSSVTADSCFLQHVIGGLPNTLNSILKRLWWKKLNKRMAPDPPLLLFISIQRPVLRHPNVWKNGRAAIQQEIWETCYNLLPPTCFILQAMDGQPLFHSPSVIQIRGTMLLDFFVSWATLSLCGIVASTHGAPCYRTPCSVSKTKSKTTALARRSFLLLSHLLSPLISATVCRTGCSWQHASASLTITLDIFQRCTSWWFSIARCPWAKVRSI